MKTNKNSMVFGLKILSILAFSLLIIPLQALAIPGYIIIDNQTPYITSISPNSSNGYIKTNMTIAITGNGFIPGSIARVNGSDRATTFIDYSHLLVRLNPNDTYNTDGFYINVFNQLPGGGYSNAEYFTINRLVPVASTNNTYASTNQIDNDETVVDSDENSSNLAATAVFGSPNSFFPSGLIQWVFFAIIILLIVILVRRIWGAKKNYEEMPMKHA